MALTLGLLVGARTGAVEWISSDPPGGTAVALVGDGAGTIWVATEGGGIFRSIDGGAVWTAVSQGLGSRATSALVRHPSGRSWIWTGDGPGSLLATCLAEDPSDGDIVFVGNRLDGIWRTSDGGSTWQQVSNGLANQRVQALAMDPSDPLRLFAGTRGGVFITADGGATWVPASTGLTDLDVTVVAFDPTDPLLLFASNRDGLFRSTDGGASWQPSGAGLGGADVTALLAADGRWWAGTDVGVFVSDDLGWNWTTPGDALALPIQDMAWDPRPDRWIAAATEGGGIMVLAADGTWSLDDPALITQTVTAITFSGDTTGYAAGDAGSWFRRGLALFADGFERGDLTAWSTTLP